ncbi:MAG: GtrA family protein [Chloroflexi bacterium]|nr:GtrA family protein [Chloroflexota bacterium]
MKSVKATRLYGVARENKTEVKRFVKFTIVGFSGLIVDFTTLNILAYVFHFPSWLAIAVAFIVAATNNFIWNRLWVYPESRKHSIWKHFPTFLLVNAVGLFINELILFLFEYPIQNLLGNAVLGLNLTKAIAAVIVMVWNFVVNRFVTFRDVKWQKRTLVPIVEEQIESAL